MKNDGITPACAGKTIISHFQIRIIEDHPHECGKNKCIMFSWDSYTRITPASAGKTCSRLRSSSATKDHPRECGKN